MDSSEDTAIVSQVGFSLNENVVVFDDSQVFSDAVLRSPVESRQQRRELSNLAAIPPTFRLERPCYAFTKRMFDIALALLLLPFVLPIIAFLGVLVWLESPGPFLFSQWRTGKCGKRFRMFKLRTMVQNADQLKQKYMHLNELTWPDFKISNDPRITRIGKFLRKTSLDELPQIFNVLIGQMSWVGPRPTSFAADTYSLCHTERLEVQPGVTGLWQVSGRSDVDFDERLRMDVEYIERRSFSYDLLIIWRTFAVVLGKRGAY
jgi:lipopolysaccharide/colanic/teichoic acid biosynthesis glycosyltransferase